MKKKMLPLARPCVGKEEEAAVLRVLRSGWLTQGRQVAALEKNISRYLGIRNSLLVNSATSGLILAVKSLNLKEDDEIICPSFSFPATANAIILGHAKPVFCDIDLNTFNILTCAIERLINKRTKAIMPVSEFGLPADMPSIMQITRKHKLAVIEDAACALGAKIGNKYAGTFGDIGVFSFHPRKIITSGEGGCAVTNNPTLLNKIASLRNHGLMANKLIDCGYNMRMSDIQAGILAAQFNKIENIIKERIALAGYYNKLLRPLYAQGIIRLPSVPENYRHVFQSYVVLLCGLSVKRDEFRESLTKNGIESQIGTYCIPALDFYKKNFRVPKLAYKNAYVAYKNTITLPLYCGLTKQDQEFIADTFIKIIKPKRGRP